MCIHFLLVHIFGSVRYQKTNSDYYIYMIIEGLVCAIGVVLASGGIGEISTYSIIFGVIFGLTVVGQLWLNLKALAIGPFSYTTVIVSLATLIAAVSGLFFGESIDLFQYFGMGVMVLCIVFSTDKNNGSRKSSLKWLVIALVSCLTNGFVGIMQKIHQNTEYKAQSTAFLVSAFAFMTVVSALLWLYERKKSGESKFNPNAKQIAFALLSGATFAVPHTANLYLAGAMPSAVFWRCSARSFLRSFRWASMLGRSSIGPGFG